jgi:aspartyl/glutamyl-tRNA(Asn/Gln) amidotransferase C subunit
MISKEEIEGLAVLARLHLAPGETEALQKDISNILAYVEAVSTVEIPQGGAARGGFFTAPDFLHNVMREDLPRAAGDALAGKRAALLKALPKEENGYNVVRKIIQKDD